VRGAATAHRGECIAGRKVSGCCAGQPETVNFQPSKFSGTRGKKPHGRIYFWVRVVLTLRKSMDAGSCGRCWLDVSGHSMQRHGVGFDSVVTGRISAIRSSGISRHSNNRASLQAELMEIPSGLSVRDELDITGRLNYREAKPILVDWLTHLRPEWIIRADLTFASLAAPERAEKAVRWWLNIISKGAWAIVGYERQERTAVHAHVVIDQSVDQERAKRLWDARCGFCRVWRIRSSEASIGYAIKHAIKGGDIDVYGPGRAGAVFSTGEQLTFGFSILSNPNQEEGAALAKLAPRRAGAGFRADTGAPPREPRRKII
jgi:hypothetical protein